MTRLAPRQRLAIDCFYFVGLSLAETAAVMGCSEGTVKSTLSDARAAAPAASGGERMNEVDTLLQRAGARVACRHNLLPQTLTCAG